MTARKTDPVAVPHQRRTRIVATLGPATDPPEVLEALLRAGVDVRTAWFALHAQALLEAACVRAGRSAEQRVAEHIRARGLRPAENGLGGGGAGIVVRPDVSRMSRADRAALAARAERGERVKLSL